MWFIFVDIFLNIIIIKIYLAFYSNCRRERFSPWWNWNGKHWFKKPSSCHVTVLRQPDICENHHKATDFKASWGKRDSVRGSYLTQFLALSKMQRKSKPNFSQYYTIHFSKAVTVIFPWTLRNLELFKVL